MTHTIRNAQLAALQMERWATAVYEQLLDSGQLAPHRRAAGLPDAPHPSVSGDADIREARFRGQTITHIRADIQRATRAGFASFGALLMLCSFRFTVGPEWFEQPKVKPLLEQSNGSEQERLDGIYSAVCGF